MPFPGATENLLQNLLPRLLSQPQNLPVLLNDQVLSKHGAESVGTSPGVFSHGWNKQAIPGKADNPKVSGSLTRALGLQVLACTV